VRFSSTIKLGFEALVDAVGHRRRARPLRQLRHCPRPTHARVLCRLAACACTAAAATHEAPLESSRARRQGQARGRHMCQSSTAPSVPNCNPRLLVAIGMNVDRHGNVLDVRTFRPRFVSRRRSSRLEVQDECHADPYCPDFIACWHSQLGWLAMHPTRIAQNAASIMRPGRSSIGCNELRTSPIGWGVGS
jgi:hypothetical protein